MSQQLQSPIAEESRWTHRLAVLLCCTTFPLVWVGGLVTTYKAGMAFPDWPTSDGYFLFFYPWLDWLRGPWDLFVEHGHRMLAAGVGLLTIALCISLWTTNQPKSLRWLGVAAIIGVIFQGVLGGVRVLLDARTFAMIHGCVGPLFFALTAVLALMTSRYWLESRSVTAAGGLWISAVALPLLVYLQLVLGAHLRHFAPEGSPNAFRAVVLFHVVLAVAVALYIFGLAIAVWRKSPRIIGLVAPATVLAILIVAQLALGVATWVYKYNWPAFLANTDLASAFTVQANGWRQAQITTAHVAIGSLILTVSTLLAAFSWRILQVQPSGAANRTRSASLTSGSLAEATP